MDTWDASLFHRMSKYYSGAIYNAFKQLLETKHLYQNLAIVLPDFDVVLKEVIEPYLGSSPSPGAPPNIKKIFDIGIYTPWKILDPTYIPQVNPTNPGVSQAKTDIRKPPEVSIIVSLPTIKVYCPICDDIEPHNLFRVHVLFKRFSVNETETNNIAIQDFSLQYQCQGCKGDPVNFMVHREKMKITICGRSPMEKVRIPKFIPNNQRSFYSSAVIAYNSGQILAGIFLLRTFIEQYVRSFSNNPKSREIDVIFREYKASLPDDFNQRFPSLLEIYEKLSDDLHAAAGSEELFLWAKDKIERHFDARRLFEELTNK